jgi:hypothetical protein
VSEKKDFCMHIPVRKILIIAEPVLFSANIPGLLPRQSISLHESSHKGADESDDEEFVRSPFDDD